MIWHVSNKRNEMTWAKNMQQNSSYPSQKHVTDASLPMHAYFTWLVKCTHFDGWPCKRDRSGGMSSMLVNAVSLHQYRSMSHEEQYAMCCSSSVGSSSMPLDSCGKWFLVTILKYGRCPEEMLKPSIPVQLCKLTETSQLVISCDKEIHL